MMTFEELNAALEIRRAIEMETSRQEKFCLEFAKHGNATEAYLTAYGTDNERTAGVQASRLLKKPSVQERLKEIQEEIANAKIADVREVQEGLTAIARRELYETVILPNGEQVQKQTTIKDALKALELLCKIHCLFVTKQELNVQSNAPIVISGGDQLED